MIPAKSQAAIDSAAAVTERITAQDILDLLPIVADRGWRVDATGGIRDKDGRCPICALLNETHSVDYGEFVGQAWFEAGLPLTFREARTTIVLAADEPKHWLRSTLMRALGMR